MLSAGVFGPQGFVAEVGCLGCVLREGSCRRGRGYVTPPSFRQVSFHFGSGGGGLCNGTLT